MKRKQIKIIFWLAVLVFSAFGISLNEDFKGVLEPLYSSDNVEVVEGESNQVTLNQNNLLQVSFLDVGQGDAIFIKTPNDKKVLIDGGPDNTVLNELGQVMPFYDNYIDVMVLTHPHADHLVGLVEILNRYEIGEIYYTGVVQSTNDYLTWLSLIQENNIPIKIVDHQFDLFLEDDVVLQFLYPNYSLLNQRMSELNNSSIVNRLVYNDIEFLFMGDAEVEVEQDLLEANVDLSSDVLKIGHHGSSSSSSEKFLLATQADYAVIMCGQDNEFGHPHLITTKRLQRANMQIFRTDQQGTITFYTNGYDLDW